MRIEKPRSSPRWGRWLGETFAGTEGVTVGADGDVGCNPLSPLRGQLPQRGEHLLRELPQRGEHL